MRISRVITAGAALLALAATSFPVGAHDHAPPKVRLKASKGSQTGALWGYQWSNGYESPFGGGCVTMFAIGTEGFPNQPVGFATGEEATIVFAKRQKPRAIALEAWPVDPSTVSQVPAQEVEVRLEKFTFKGERRWRAVFAPPFPVDDYLHLFVRWEDTGGCGSETMDLGFWMRLEP